MKRYDMEDDLKSTINRLISEEKFGEAISYLQTIIDSDHTNKMASAIMEQLKTILKYQNRDLFASTNLDMDPWLE